MLEQFLPTIKDPGDYLTALSLFKVDAPLTGEEAGKLLEVYAKYLPETDDPEYCRICLAADLLPGREDPADFAALELGDATVAALLETSGIIAGKAEVDGGRAKHIAEIVKGEAASLPARVLLARAALDVMAGARDVASLRGEIAVLAEFLTDCGTEVLDRYTPLVGEVRMKCRN